MGSLKGLDARKAAMVMGIMTLHAFSEGLGVGVSYGGANGRRQVCVCVWGGGGRSPRALAPALFHCLLSACPSTSGSLWQGCALGAARLPPSPLLDLLHLCACACSRGFSILCAYTKTVSNILFKGGGVTRRAGVGGTGDGDDMGDSAAQHPRRPGGGARGGPQRREQVDCCGVGWSLPPSLAPRERMHEGRICTQSGRGSEGKHVLSAPMCAQRMAQR
jgi:hypothetical protein